MIKMLIVDDDWMITDSLNHMDEWIDMNIDVVGTAHNGEEALFWLEKEPVDIIITDIRMPKMDGLSLTKYIYDEKIDTNIIIMSGFEEFTYAQEALQYNARRYLLKPLDTDELLDAVQHIQDQYLSKNEKLVKSSNPNKQSQTQQERIITSTLNYIHSNYMDPLTLKELADRVHFSDHYLGQLFKSVTGVSFLKYLTDIRMKNAKILLGNPMLKVYEISERIGYSDSKHFTKIFRRTFGCTPSEYRQKYFSISSNIN